MIKNDVFTLDITDVTSEGFGIGHYGGMAVFVPFTAVGDKAKVTAVKVKPNYAYGKMLEILSPSEDRTEVDCPYFYRCGGCAFRHISYKSELEIKLRRVDETLRRIGGAEIRCGGIVGANTPDGYRNKAQFPFSENAQAGFFAPRSHRVIPIKNCALLPEVLNGISECVSAFCKEYSIPVYSEKTHTGLLRHLYIREGAVSGEIMAVLVINDNTLPSAEKLVCRLKALLGDRLKSLQININKKDTNVILGDENKVIYGEPYINDTLCGVKVRLSPFTFYQVNHGMAEKLYEKAAEYAAPEDKSVIDLYCGAGTIGLSMAKKAKRVTGVEIVPEAVEDARRNAEACGIKNANFICGDAASAAIELHRRGETADVVILDPPRKGCDSALLETVANGFSPEKIVYVSCDPATLARDIKILSSLGYNAEEYTVFDMFPRTAHCEAVCKLLRSDINS